MSSRGFPCGTVVKNPPANAGEWGDKNRNSLCLPLRPLPLKKLHNFTSYFHHLERYSKDMSNYETESCSPKYYFTVQRSHAYLSHNSESLALAVYELKISSVVSYSLDIGDGILSCNIQKILLTLLGKVDPKEVLPVESYPKATEAEPRPKVISEID
ncbi:hypothetical protein MG293_020517 [Ovis ammon polii]|uniref:Uncharacterized protein n=1 Tax=Ovis ammon polii TaxID=230172 RepID=A0AAD4XZ93_OVIAM|nr:hypothetical protein MG293_020517 [Ovis ammon polii]